MSAKSMKEFVFFLLTAFMLALIPSQGAAWQTLTSGLHYKKILIPQVGALTTPSEKNERAIHAFKISLRHWEIKPMIATQGLASVKTLTEQNQAVLGINANFFDEGGRALGLVIKDGKQFNPLKKISWWGLFYIEDENPRIAHSSQFTTNPKITQAIQAGPRLLIDGKIPELKVGRSAKTAIGINQQGDVILLVSKSSIDILELAELMARPVNKGGLGCINALNLDGGSSSQLYSRVREFELGLPSYVRIPVGLGVFAKD